MNWSKKNTKALGTILLACASLSAVVSLFPEFDWRVAVTSATLTLSITVGYVISTQLQVQLITVFLGVCFYLIVLILPIRAAVFADLPLWLIGGALAAYIFAWVLPWTGFGEALRKIGQRSLDDSTRGSRLVSILTVTGVAAASTAMYLTRSGHTRLLAVIVFLIVAPAIIALAYLSSGHIRAHKLPIGSEGQ